LKNKTHNRKKILIITVVFMMVMIFLGIRISYLMIFRSEYYQDLAEELHERERSIKAARGKIYDANGEILATNTSVCTISVIYNQVTDREKVIEVLTKELGLSEESVRAKVEKRSSREKIKSNVDIETGDRIREYNLDGVKVDEDYKRYYPYSSLASKVLGFTGGDNQGIIGLEVKYESFLKGVDGSILTMTDARGVELSGMAESRVDPIPGNDLYTSLDVNIQKYAEQAANKVLEAKQANAVSIVVMNPQNGEIMAMVNVPEFDLNDPYTLTDVMYEELGDEEYTSEKEQELLNKMWRNPSINDTYEPGSTFKIVTAMSALEEGVVDLNDTFSCPGYKIVEDRRIRCHKVGGHGAETFLQGTMNSCNPVFIEVGSRLGTANFYKYFEKLGLLSKTGIDLPGEASTIMHKQEDVGAVELATVSFGQSFQITPIQLLRVASIAVNGGHNITPHIGTYVKNSEGTVIETFEYDQTEQVISKETSDTMRYILEQVVAEGTGNKAYIPGYRIGGKTATSQKLPRSIKKYISSFIGFAPADDPKVIALITIDEPEGIYYGGTIAAPVIKELYANILPYLGIEPVYTEAEIEEYDISQVAMPDFIGKTEKEAEELLKENGLEGSFMNETEEDEIITDQFPVAGEMIDKNSTILLWLGE
jgi:stage V sporulation protein D (sporulation-specific penicillin-binding protein)